MILGTLLPDEAPTQYARRLMMGIPAESRAASAPPGFDNLLMPSQGTSAIASYLDDCGLEDPWLIHQSRILQTDFAANVARQPVDVAKVQEHPTFLGKVKHWHQQPRLNANLPRSSGR